MSILEYIFEGLRQICPSRSDIRFHSPLHLPSYPISLPTNHNHDDDTKRTQDHRSFRILCFAQNTGRKARLVSVQSAWCMARRWATSNPWSMGRMWWWWLVSAHFVLGWDCVRLWTLLQSSQEWRWSYRDLLVRAGTLNSLILLFLTLSRFLLCAFCCMWCVMLARRREYSSYSTTSCTISDWSISRIDICLFSTASCW